MSGVRQRTVFYVAGFDARGVPHYHPLYRDQAALQSAMAGPPIEVSDPQLLSNHLTSWTVTRGETQTTYIFCNWGDIVRPFFKNSPARMWWNTLTATVRFVATGALGKSIRWSWPFALTISLPILLLVLFPVLGLAAIVSGFAIGSSAAIALGSLVGLALLWLSRRWTKRFHVTWLARALPFFVRDEAGTIPGLDTRLDLFADAVARAMDNAANDEVLLVGHSYGTPLAVKIAERALRRADGTRLSLLTLGQVVPLLAWLPRASAMREALRTVSHSRRVDWIDFSAPADGACYAFVDPLTALGEDAGDRTNPKLLNAKFHETMPADRYAKAKRDWQALHFQYILAGIAPGSYDYFAITAGDRTLADRFAGRASVRDFTRLRIGATKDMR